MNPYQVNFATWNKVAALYQERFMDVDLYDDTYDRFLQLLPQPGAAVLEIGCGPGNIARYLLTRRPDLRLTGLDVAPNMVALAQANNPTAAFQVFDCRDLNQLPGPYAGIVCGFCLPYLARPEAAQLLRDCARLLPAGGVAYFSTIEGDYAQSSRQTNSLGDPMYLYYYDETYLQTELAAQGFEVLELTRKAYPQGPQPPASHLIFVVRKR